MKKRGERNVEEERAPRGQRTSMGQMKDEDEGARGRAWGTNNEAHSKFGSRKLNREGFLGYV